MIDFDALVLGPCVTAFGEEVTFTPAIGPEITVSGIFDKAYQRVEFQGDVPVTTTGPMLGCQASSFTGDIPVQDDIFTIRGIDYRVVDVAADGQGHLNIQLMLAP